MGSGNRLKSASGFGSVERTKMVSGGGARGGEEEVVEVSASEAEQLKRSLAEGGSPEDREELVGSSASAALPCTFQSCSNFYPHQISTAVRFLANPRVSSRPDPVKTEFLLKKGLTEADVEEARKRAAASGAPAQGHLQEEEEERRRYPVTAWTRLNGLAGVAFLLWLAAKGIRHLWKVAKRKKAYLVFFSSPKLNRVHFFLFLDSEICSHMALWRISSEVSFHGTAAWIAKDSGGLGGERGETAGEGGGADGDHGAAGGGRGKRWRRPERGAGWAAAEAAGRAAKRRQVREGVTPEHVSIACRQLQPDATFGHFQNKKSVINV